MDDMRFLVAVEKELIDTNILIVGNGFDLAHGLPTRYMDFMDYLSMAETLYKNKTDPYARPNKTTIEGYINNQYTDVDATLRNNLIGKYDSEWINSFPRQLSRVFSEKNCWYKYFEYLIYKKQLQDVNWIDFEAEISKVVQKVEHSSVVEEDRFNSMSNIQLYQIDRGIHEEILLNFMNATTYTFKTNEFNSFIKQLEKDLSDFINALDYYIAFIDEFSVEKRVVDIQEIDVDKVISFNYTDTYRRLYYPNMPDEKIHFIHGKANRTLGDSASKLVLGTNDTLSDQEKDSNTSCLKFKKYFQRIYKRTGNDYKMFLKDALERKKVSGESTQSYFFGHSLAATDGDVIRRVIEASDHVVIFYHDDMQHREAITNLVMVLGRDKLIEYAEERIEFRKQRE